MANHWNNSGVPHKGWICLSTEDIRHDGDSVEETNYATCQMCNKEQIRFVHIMKHPNYHEELRVGCICAEKMSGDYVGPRAQLAELRNRSSRRVQWLKRKWKMSRNGNEWLQTKGFHVVVWQENGVTIRYRLFINNKRGKYTYDSEVAAKLAAFDAIELMRQRKSKFADQ